MGGRPAKPWTIDLAPEAQEVWEGRGLAEDDRVVINLWAQMVRKHGPDELQKHPGQWNDHPLIGHWAGCRASSFSNRGRILNYRFNTQGIVQVLRITAEHDYAKDGKKR